MQKNIQAPQRLKNVGGETETASVQSIFYKNVRN